MNEQRKPRSKQWHRDRIYELELKEQEERHKHIIDLTYAIGMFATSITLLVTSFTLHTLDSEFIPENILAILSVVLILCFGLSALASLHLVGCLLNKKSKYSGQIKRNFDALLNRKPKK